MSNKQMKWTYIGFFCFFIALLAYEIYAGYALNVIEEDTPEFKVLFIFTVLFTIYNCYTITKAIIKYHQNDDKTQNERNSWPHEEL